ncbi:MAG TPA: hypothetical protein VKN63_06250 [Afifellaceae bacterium]|nr:hypothetical protein [Afifellaceae bacterium]
MSLYFIAIAVIGIMSVQLRAFRPPLLDRLPNFSRSSDKEAFHILPGQRGTARRDGFGPNRWT